MHRPVLAGPRRRTRRALLAAALPAALAAVALPSAAQAGIAEINTAAAGGVAVYVANDGETNEVSVGADRIRNKLVISDSAPITARNGCTLNAAGDAECPINVGSVILLLRDDNDRVQYTAPHRASISGEAGNDTFFGALRSAASGRPIEPVFYFGGAGFDAMDYAFTDRGVRVDTDDFPGGGLSEDGRPAIDRETIGRDVELILGSDFADVLFGSDVNDQIMGRKGDDQIAGGLGGDTFIEHDVANGADSLDGGPGQDRVSYADRTGGVNVSLDGVRDDGEPGERDDVRGNVEHVNGGAGADTLIGDGVANDLVGFGGADNIEGRGGNDILTGGASNNRLAGGEGNDVINARNGELDNIDCGENSNDSDTANRDTAENLVVGCERGTVGVLRLTPATVRGEAGKVARMRLSWRHPQGWRKLRTVELRLLSQDGVPVGEVTIRPRRARISADGGVELVRKHSRLSHKGKTVTARLALRLDKSLADQTLKAEVEATDTRGRRQLERDAGTVRVAR